MPPKKRSNKRASSSHSFDTTKFWNEEAQKIYEDTLARPIIKEGGIDMSTPHYRLVQKLVNRGWVELAKSPIDAVVPIVREFYANLRVKHESYKVLVRGKFVAFDATTINMIYDLPSFDNDEYTEYIAGNIDYNTIIRDLCVEGAEWRTNQEVPVTLKKSEMLRDPSSWASFILAKILPSTHQTEITKDKVVLIHAITTGKSVDLGKIIHGSIMRAGTGLITLGLPCPHIITDLCHYAGVTWGVDEQVLKPKAPIIVFPVNLGHGQKEFERQQERAAYNQRARNRKGPPPPPVNRITMVDRITRIEQDIRAQRKELTEYRQSTNTFMAYMIDFTSVLAQRFPPTEPMDTDFPSPPAWPPQYPPQHIPSSQQINEDINAADNNNLSDEC